MGMVAITQTSYSLLDAVSGAALQLGSAASALLSQIVVFDGGAADRAAELVLHDQAGNPFVFWVDATGDFRVEGAATKTGDLAGAVVGTQA